MSEGISGDLLFASENIIFRRNELDRYSDKHDSFYERNAVKTTLKLKPVLQ